MSAPSARYLRRTRGFSRPFSAGCSLSPSFEGRCRVGRKQDYADRYLRQHEWRCRATGYFIYDWGLKDGSAARFECVDVFEFDVAGLIERMIIVYDTHPIRSTVGDKYA